jgi:hypothetical protein
LTVAIAAPVFARTDSTVSVRVGVGCESPPPLEQPPSNSRGSKITILANRCSFMSTAYARRKLLAGREVAPGPATYTSVVATGCRTLR